MKLTFFLTIILLASSCVKDVEYKLDFGGSKTVVFAGGEANQKLHAYITKTISPLIEVENPDSMVVKDAFIEIYENEKIIDTMYYDENLKYYSNITLKTGFAYKIKITLSNGTILNTRYDTVPEKAKFIEGKVKLNRIDTSSNYNDYFFDTRLKIKKSNYTPYNDLNVKFCFSEGIINQYYYLHSKSELIECDGCLNILNNECITNINKDYVLLENEIKLNYPIYDINELDSIKFYLNTYSRVANKICQNGIDLEEYYNNPLPFASNPSVDFTNIEGGYGLFILSAADSLTIKF